MKTMLRDTNVIPNGAGQGIPYASSWSSTYESFGQLRTSHPFFVHHLSHHPMTLAVVPLCWCLGFLFVCLVWVSCLFCRVLVPVLQVSGNFSNPPRVLDLDDRQGLIASSAMQ